MIIGQAGDGVPIDDLVHHRSYARVEGGGMTGCPMLDSEYAARQNGKRLPCERLVDENAKLREQLEGIVGRSFRTADKMACLEAENSRLIEELADAPKYDECEAMFNCEDCEAMLDCDECLRADASQKERKRLDYENAKLRELVKDMVCEYECGYLTLPQWLADRMCELGVEV